MRRWLRAAIPFTALTVLVTGTLIVHAVQTPDTDDPAFLAPDRAGQISGGTLAERLRARGVTVETMTSTEAAVDAVRRAPATLFITTPDLADLPRVNALPSSTRVVVVAPSDSALRRSSWPLQTRDSRWSTRVTAPACPDPLATAAGPAAVLGTSYQPLEGASICYSGALVTMTVDGSYTLTVVGSPDPFRDDRISEHGNAALAVGLLSQHPRLVWLDVHVRDRPVPTTPPTGFDYTPQPDATDAADIPGDPGTVGPGDSEPDDSNQDDDTAGSGSGGAERNPLLDIIPPAVWATLILLALILLALAAAAARRLGAPVAEPLPSRVAASETMLGHARLYQRARARRASLDILITATRHRLTRHLALPADASIDDIAARAALPVRYVRDILDREPPRSNADLVEAATLVQLLEREVTHPHETHPHDLNPHEGEQP